MSLSTKNIERILAHLEKENSPRNELIYKDKLLDVLHFLKQAEDQKLEITGMDYKTFNGSDLMEKNEILYEGGWIAKKNNKN